LGFFILLIHNLIDITKSIITKHHLNKEDIVLTFIGEEEHLSIENQKNLYVMQNYLNILDQIKDQLPQFKNSIKYDFNTEILEGQYTFNNN
jgi:3-methyladenine DNA glycosylase AlkC